MLFLSYDSTAAIEWFFLFLVNFRVLLSFLNAREKTCGQWKRQAKVRYNSWEIRAGKICKTNFMQSEARKEVPGLLSLLLKTEKKKMYELVFSERYMLLWVKWEIPVPLILFRWLVLHWWWATCNESTCLFTGSREGNDNWRIRNLKRRIGNEWVQKEIV